MTKNFGLSFLVIAGIIAVAPSAWSETELIPQKDMKVMQESVAGYDVINQGEADDQNVLFGMLGPAPVKTKVPVPDEDMQVIVASIQGHDPLNPEPTVINTITHEDGSSVVITDANGDGNGDTYTHIDAGGDVTEIDADTNHDGENDTVTMDGTVVYSDINGDGKVDGADYTLYLQAYQERADALKLQAQVNDGDLDEERRLRLELAKFELDLSNTISVFHSLLFGSNLDTEENQEILSQIQQSVLEMQIMLDVLI